jgi:hypothetical protein
MNLKSRISQFSVLSLVVLLAGVTLSLAWPRMQASYRFLPVDIAIGRYYDQREIPTHRILTLMGFAGEAIARHDHYRYHDGLSFLHYLRGLDIYTPALGRRGQYRAAEAAAMAVVKLAPAQPEAWLRIATVRAILRDEPGDVLEPWKMSVYTGRTHSTLMAPRVGIALPYLEFMDKEARAMLRDQLLLAWALKPLDLLHKLKQADRRLERARALIGNSAPAVLAEMEERIEKIR